MGQLHDIFSLFYFGKKTLYRPHINRETVSRNFCFNLDFAKRQPSYYRQYIVKRWPPYVSTIVFHSPTNKESILPNAYIKNIDSTKCQSVKNALLAHSREERMGERKDRKKR